MTHDNSNLNDSTVPASLTDEELAEYRGGLAEIRAGISRPALTADDLAALLSTIDRRTYDLQRLYESHEHNVRRALRFIEAGTDLVNALNTRDGRGFMHRDAALEGRWKKLRDELGIETPPPGVTRT